jgi:HTH-type transcriptional regulator / antitoxin HipB
MDLNLAFPEQLSQHLRSLRKTQGWTQAQLASRIGVAQSRISAIEKDATSLTAEQLFRWLAALNTRLVLRPEATLRQANLAEPGIQTPVDPSSAGGEW